MFVRLAVLLIVFAVLLAAIPYAREMWIRHQLADRLAIVDPVAKTALDHWGGDVESFLQDLFLRCALTRDPQSASCQHLRIADEAIR